MLTHRAGLQDKTYSEQKTLKKNPGPKMKIIDPGMSRVYPAGSLSHSLVHEILAPNSGRSSDFRIILITAPSLFLKKQVT